jgi:hypothetical protein
MKALVAKFRELETYDDSVMGFLLGNDDKPANYDEGGWHDYNCRKFGVKWDFQLSQANEVCITDEEIIIDVDTAWSAPTIFVESLCKLYGVTANMKYFEPGMDFSGIVECDENGNIDDEQLSFLEGVYKAGDDFWGEVEWRADSAVENDESLEEFRSQFESFVPEEEMGTIDEMYAEAVERAKAE